MVYPNETLRPSFWDSDITLFTAGQCHTLNNSYTIGTNRTHLLQFTLVQNNTYLIRIHDPHLSILNFNPDTFPDVMITLKPNSGLMLYYIKAIIHVNLKTKTNQCEESEEYSFKSCVKNSIGRKVGCRLPWDKWTDPWLPICTLKEQLIKVDDEFQNAMYISKEVFASITGCSFPCKYVEYQLVGQPLMFFPSAQGFSVLLANSDILETRETVIYTFESFLAEVGGALGLFLGFSFFALFTYLKDLGMMMIFWINKK